MSPADNILRYMFGYKVTYLLFFAAQYKLFDYLVTPVTVQDIAEQLQLHSGALEIMLDIFTALGFLQKKDNQYQLVAGYQDLLTSQTQQSMLPLLNMESYLLGNYNTFPAIDHAMTTGNARDLFNQNEKDGISAIYGTAMDNGSRLAALHVARMFSSVQEGHILDLGGGAGSYSIKICNLNKHVQADIFDLADMQQVCEENIRQAGLTDRVHFTIKDARLDPIEGTYHGILISNLLHLLTKAEIADLLQRCSQALRPDGCVVLHDFFLKADKVGPEIPLLFTIDWLLIGTNFNYSVLDIADLCRPLGLKVVESKFVENLPTSLIMLRKEG